MIKMVFKIFAFIFCRCSSDLQLAIALQQQEFEQQPQRQNVQQPSSGGSSRLVVGPQVEFSYGPYITPSHAIATYS